MFNIKEIDVHTLAHLLGTGESVTLVDIRNGQELLETGVIPGAVHVPMQELGHRVQKLMQDSQEVIFYCRSGARSAHVCSILTMNGVHNAVNLKGGIVEWLRHNKPVSALNA